MNRELQVGDIASLSKAFTEEDIIQFAGILEDKNPVHLDESYAAKSVFRQRIVHGMLVASLFSKLLGTDLPGEGTILLGQTLSFKAPVAIREEVTASVEVVRIREDKPIVTLHTLCVDNEGQIVIDGEAVVKVL